LCANLNSAFELFCGGGCYFGAEVGSELNNFVVNHSNNVGIVYLDEFDRLKPELRDGLFMIFDNGEWVNKKHSSQSQ
jgi:transcriptional regulator with AAA-type ATPase domain